MNRIEYVDTWFNVKLVCDQVNDLEDDIQVVRYWLNQFGVFDVGYLNYYIYNENMCIVKSGETCVLEYTIGQPILVYD